MKDLGFAKTESWENIQYRLTNTFEICHCQRKIKTIVGNLVSIKDKCTSGVYDLTGAEWLLVAIMDSRDLGIMHGINCEYPIIDNTHILWRYIDLVKDNPNLEDN